ncbi:hypothetical protein [Ideonella azotifigens]|uniref:Uncharacterized protein n=2 Tax=Ideonella azotifigens TaxID=513160 RepID=A0ABN1KCA6_9BURK|nr:hypothetical protein [Ideonella azotifigens]
MLSNAKFSLSAAFRAAARCLSWLIALGAFGAAQGSNASEVVIKQAVANGGSYSLPYYMPAAQTFVANSTQIDSISVSLSNSSFSSLGNSKDEKHVTMVLYRGDTINDASKALRQVVVNVAGKLGDAPGASAMVAYHFSPPVDVTPGETYTFQVFAMQPRFWINSSNSNPYPDGHAYLSGNPNDELVFKVTRPDSNASSTVVSKRNKPQ